MPPDRRTFLKSLGAVSLAAPLERPNIVILLADDLGWSDVHFQGAEFSTPNLDRLAQSGVRFTRFYSQPLCSPTRSALMTGRSPMRFGVQYHVIRPWMSYGVPLSEHFLSESFRAAGYQTAVIGKWHLGHARRAYLPNARGFDHAYGHLNGMIDYFTHMRDGGLDWHRNGRSVREEGYATDLLAKEAVRFLEQRDRRRPFLLYLAFNAPHAPLQAPAERIAMFASIADPRRRTYAAMVHAMDEAAGKVLATLEREGIARQTLLLFFSDNGGAPAQAGRNVPLRGAKGSCWEGGIRVPAVMYWPGRLQPATTDQLMSAIDVFPTLAAAAGIQTRNQLPLDGKNLWEAITSGRTQTRDPLFFAVETTTGFQYAVHTGEWKLVRQGNRQWLFHISEDPHEQRDLAGSQAKLARELSAWIDDWARLHPTDGVRLANQAPAGWKAPPLWAEAARSD